MGTNARKRVAPYAGDSHARRHHAASTERAHGCRGRIPSRNWYVASMTRFRPPDAPPTDASRAAPSKAEHAFGTLHQLHVKTDHSNRLPAPKGCGSCPVVLRW